MTWHGYYVLEDLGLDASQRQTPIDTLCRLGPAAASHVEWEEEVG